MEKDVTLGLSERRTSRNVFPRRWKIVPLYFPSDVLPVCVFHLASTFPLPLLAESPPVVSYLLLFRYRRQALTREIHTIHIQYTHWWCGDSQCANDYLNALTSSLSFQHFNFQIFHILDSGDFILVG